MTTRHKKAGQSEKKTTLAPLFDHHFQRPELVTWALTHRSLAYETNPDSLPDPAADNEQLEFVGCSCFRDLFGVVERLRSVRRFGLCDQEEVAAPPFFEAVRG